MATIQSRDGRLYSFEQWFAQAHTREEQKKLEQEQAKAIQEKTFDWNAPIRMRTVLVDQETGERAPSIIDVGSYLYVEQDDGSWNVSTVQEAES